MEVTGERPELPQPPPEPQKPLMPYLRFSQHFWGTLGKKRKGGIAAAGAEIGAKWRSMTEEERRPFKEAYEAEKREYLAAMRRYYDTDEYKQYMRTRELVKAEQIKHDRARKQQEALLWAQRKQTANTQAATHRMSQHEAIARAKASAEALSHAAEQCNQRGPSLEFSARRLAAARYARNQCLMEKLFVGQVEEADTEDAVTEAQAAPILDEMEKLCKSIEEETESLKRKHEAIMTDERRQSEEFDKRYKAMMTGQMDATVAAPDTLINRAVVIWRRSDLDASETPADRTQSVLTKL